MPEATPPHVPDLGAFRQWKPEVQAKALDLLNDYQQSGWKPFYCPIPKCDGNHHIIADGEPMCVSGRPHKWEKGEVAWGCDICHVTGKPFDDWLWRHARHDQRPPRWTPDWMTLLFRGGRGSGKTRSGSEITQRVTEKVPQIALIARTGPDLRETMVEGRSGLLATAPPGKRPLWEPSKKKLTWPNGCVALGFSAEEPDRLRGPEHGFVWMDEPAHYDYAEDVWDNMLFGLRIGDDPKVVGTTTPLPTKFVKKLIADEDTVNHVVSSYANIHNLSPTYQKNVIKKFEGTRQGRQELFGEILEDVEGSLWKYEMFHWCDPDDLPSFTRIVVAVDPAGSTDKRADETGIVVVGLGTDGKVYILADRTGKYTPAKWGELVWKTYNEFSADAVVAEKNYGGQMVEHVLESTQRDLGRIILVESRRGKQLRAEPVVALYEKAMVVHAGERGTLMDLEDEQTSWIPGHGASPNRVDALVHGVTSVAKNIMPAAVASPTKVLAGRQMPVPGARPNLRLIS